MKLFLESIEKSWKLQGSLEFQGLPIAIENKAGDVRHWKDENSGESGSTVQKYPYGYVKETLGVDGDEVDVFIGPKKDGDKVFIITQMKKPGFTEVDEQKVMLGFEDEADAKRAYLEHYNNPKFFGSMKTFTVEEFKEKLHTYKGKLIKHLFSTMTSANIPWVAKSVKEQTMTEPVKKSCDHGKSEECQGDTKDILKGLTSRMLSLTKRAVERRASAPVEEFSTTEVTLFGPQVAQSLHVDRGPFEPPSVPVVRIETPAPAASPLSPDFMTSCGGCGYVHKSLDSCPRCASMAASNRTSVPVWRR